MKIVIDIPEYSPEKGIQLHWDAGFEIHVTADHEGCQIKANPAGLRSLARHCLALAQEGAPPGGHFHLDQFNALEQDSAELVISRI